MLHKSQLPLILITAFLDILGISLFLPLLPSIIAGFGVQSSWSGYTQAMYAFGMFVGGLFFGKLSDIYGRKRLLTFTSIINFLSYIILCISIWNVSFYPLGNEFSDSGVPIEFSGIHALDGITSYFVIFLIARFLGGLGGSGFSVIQAYIADISRPADRAKNMGLMGAAFGMAFLIWPAISAVLSNIVSFHAIIMFCSIVIFINVLFIFFRLEEPRKHIHTPEVHIIHFHFSHTILVLFALSFGMTLAFSSMQAMSGQFYTDRFGFTAQQIGYTMTIVGLVSLIYQGFVVKFVRMYMDEIQMMYFSFCILIIGFIGFSYNMSPFVLFIWIPLFPIGMGSFRPSLGSLLAKNAGKEVGKVMGYNVSIESVGQFVGPILAGVFYVFPGSGLPFRISAGIFFLLSCFGYLQISDSGVQCIKRIFRKNYSSCFIEKALILAAGSLSFIFY